MVSFEHERDNLITIDIDGKAFIRRLDAEKILGYKLFKTKKLEFKIINKVEYVSQEEMRSMLEVDKDIKENYITKKEAEKLLGRTLTPSIYKGFTYKIKRQVVYIKREEIFEAVEVYNTIKDDYITEEEAEELLGYNLNIKSIRDIGFEHKIIKQIVYIKREDILKTVELNNTNNYIRVSEAERLLGFRLDKKIYCKEIKTYKVMGRVGYISQMEVTEMLNFQNEINENYISIKKAEEILGREINGRNKLNTYLVNRKIGYLSKDEFIELLNRTGINIVNDEELGIKIKQEEKKDLQNEELTNNYITKFEAEKVLGYRLYEDTYRKKSIKYKKINNVIYFSAEDIEDLLKIKNEFLSEKYILKSEAAKLIEENRLKVLIKSKKINTYNGLGSYSYIKREEIEKYIDYYKKLQEDYISILEAEKNLGVGIKRNRQFFETYEVIEGKSYIKRTEFEKLRILKDNTIFRVDLVKNNNLSPKKVEAAIEVLNIKQITSCPFHGGYNLLTNEDAEKVLDYIKYRDEKEKTVGFVDNFLLSIKDMPYKSKLEKTIECFNEFVVKKSKSFKTAKSIKARSKIYANAYEILLNSLDREFDKYSSEQIDSILKLVINNNKYTKNGKKVFIKFINYIIKAWKLKNYKEYKNDSYDDSQKVVGYTQIQFLELFALLHNGVKNRTYLSQAITNRTYAMAWLYMYLHYIMIWRGSDIIEKLSKPNLLHLNIPEVNDGESFLNWLSDEKNIFTDDMGEIMAEDVRYQVHALKKKTGKTNQNLFLEVGRLTAPVLGLLLAICEAHRQIEEKKGHKGRKTDNILTGSVMTQHKKDGVFDTIFDGKVISILGERFGNRRANKSYNNYIHNYSEENHSKFAVHLLSILRGYVDEESQTTTIYETRKSEGTIDAVVATLFNRGSFAFAKFKLLEAQDKSFLSLDFDTQTEAINNLNLTPYQSEVVVKNIYNTRKEVTSLLSKMATQPKKIQKIMEELAFGDTESKHNHSRCLYKALLNSETGDIKDLDINDIDGFAFIEILKDYRFNANCLHPDIPTCFGCQMLIGEMYFLYELKEVLYGTINKLKNCKSELEQHIYSDIICNAYLPILREARVALGVARVSFIINSKKLKNELYNLHKVGKIKLTEFTGGKIDSSIK